MVEDEGEKYYESETVTPKYRFFVPGQITFLSKPSEFKVVKLNGRSELDGNIVATRFEAAHESTDEGLVIGKRVQDPSLYW